MSIPQLWFKAQTRVWDYDLQNAGDRRERTKQPMDNSTSGDSKRPETSQDVVPSDTDDETTHPTEDLVVGRVQAAGLLAPDGNVDHILETVVNNLVITNNLDVAGVRCRVLLTTPLESFLIGRTIVLSRGLLDVLPDEATLAAVLAHELAHVILGHTNNPSYLRSFASPVSDAEVFAALDFHFDRTQEEDASNKALELFSKSPYKDQAVNIHFFLKAFDASSARFPNFLHGRYSNDFRSSHLIGMQARIDSSQPAKADRSNRISALPIGSRIVVDPWSDRIEMLKSKPVLVTSPAEKIPFEVTPFYPYLKRLEVPEKPGGAR
jgi:hypothetical protein